MFPILTTILLLAAAATYPPASALAIHESASSGFNSVLPARLDRHSYYYPSGSSNESVDTTTVLPSPTTLHRPNESNESLSQYLLKAYYTNIKSEEEKPRNRNYYKPEVINYKPVNTSHNQTENIDDSGAYYSKHSYESTGEESLLPELNDYSEYEEDEEEIDNDGIESENIVMVNPVDSLDETRKFLLDTKLPTKNTYYSTYMMNNDNRDEMEKRVDSFPNQLIYTNFNNPAEEGTPLGQNSSHETRNVGIGNANSYSKGVKRGNRKKKPKKLQIVYIKVPLLNLVDKSTTTSLIEDDVDDSSSETESSPQPEVASSLAETLHTNYAQYQSALNNIDKLNQTQLQLLSSQFYNTWLPLASNPSLALLQTLSNANLTTNLLGKLARLSNTTTGGKNSSREEGKAEWSSPAIDSNGKNGSYYFSNYYRESEQPVARDVEPYSGNSGGGFTSRDVDSSYQWSVDGLIRNATSNRNYTLLQSKSLGILPIVIQIDDDPNSNKTDTTNQRGNSWSESGNNSTNNNNNNSQAKQSNQWTASTFTSKPNNQWNTLDNQRQTNFPNNPGTFSNNFQANNFQSNSANFGQNNNFQPNSNNNNNNFQNQAQNNFQPNSANNGFQNANFPNAAPASGFQAANSNFQQQNNFQPNSANFAQQNNNNNNNNNNFQQNSPNNGFQGNSFPNVAPASGFQQGSNGFQQQSSQQQNSFAANSNGFQNPGKGFQQQVPPPQQQQQQQQQQQPNNFQQPAMNFHPGGSNRHHPARPSFKPRNPIFDDSPAFIKSSNQIRAISKLPPPPPPPPRNIKLGPPPMGTMKNFNLNTFPPRGKKMFPPRSVGANFWGKFPNSMLKNNLNNRFRKEKSLNKLNKLNNDFMMPLASTLSGSKFLRKPPQTANSKPFPQLGMDFDDVFFQNLPGISYDSFIRMTQKFNEQYLASGAGAGGDNAMMASESSPVKATAVVPPPGASGSNLFFSYMFPAQGGQFSSPATGDWLANTKSFTSSLVKNGKNQPVAVNGSLKKKPNNNQSTATTVETTKQSKGLKKNSKRGGTLASRIFG